MNSIDPSKIITELTRSDAEINKDISKEISTKLSSAMSEKQRSDIGLLLKKTLDNLSQSGLLSIDTQKAVLRARQMLPAEFTQIYIQDRVVQHKLAQAAIESAAITPRELTIGTLQQWFPGQVIQAIVYQQTQNGLASLLVNGSGQFDGNILAQISAQIPQTTTQAANQTIVSAAQQQLQIKSVLELLSQVPMEVVQKTLKQMLADNIISTKAAVEITAQLSSQKQGAHQQDVQNPALQNPLSHKQNKQKQTNETIAANTPLNNKNLQQSQPVSNQAITPAAQVQQQIKSALELLSKLPPEVIQKTLRLMLSDKIISPPAAAEILLQLRSHKQGVQKQGTQQQEAQSQLIQTQGVQQQGHQKQTPPAENIVLANNPINNKLIQQSQVVQIKTDLLLLPGQQLLIQVNKNAGDISFQLHHSPKESHQVSQYINQYMTKQQALPQLLASLQEISSHNNQANSYFTAQFIKQADKLLQQFPQLTQLTSINEIKNAVQNSGQFLENKLLHSVSQALNPVETQNNMNHASRIDLKANLSRLAAMIQNGEALLLPKNLSSEQSLYQSIEHKTLVDTQFRAGQFFDLPNRVIHAQVQAPAADNLFQLNSHLLLQNRVLDQLEGVLSRLIATQLFARESGSEQAQLNFEIPFRNNDQQEVLQLKIREEFKDEEAQKGNKIWTVNMAFHLPALGGIRIYITLDKEDLAIQFWTEEKNCQQLLQQFFPLLKERLFDADFTISQLTAFHGIPEAAEQEQQSSQFIVDERV